MPLPNQETARSSIHARSTASERSPPSVCDYLFLRISFGPQKTREHQQKLGGSSIFVSSSHFLL